MRVLLDEQLPRPLAEELVGHEVRTVQSQRWAGLKNRELFRQAVSAGYEVFVTYDSNLEFQQHLIDFAIGFVVLQAPSDDFDDLLPLVPGILEAISAVEPGQVAHVAA